jgi:hypothetical protein
MRGKINTYVGKQEQLLSVIRHRKLGWYGQVTRHDSWLKHDKAMDSQRLSKEK